MIAWLASYPRSGNTFARFVLQRMYGITSPAVYPAPPRPMFPELNRPIMPDEARDMSETVVFKTHELPADDFRAIYLVRDGRDALVSHAHFVLKFDRKLASFDRQQFLEVLRNLIEETDSFGGWSGNVRAWTTRSAATQVLFFEELIASPAATMRAAVESLRLPLREDRSAEIPTFAELHDRNANFFRKGSVGGWRDEMPNDLHELFWQRHGDTMIAMGYPRDGQREPVSQRTTSAA